MKRSASKKDTSPSVDLRALAEYVEQFSSKTIVVLGDFVADVFEFGEISRVSREAPVLILRHRETQLVPGGGANAANNFADLGAEVLPVTIVGDDRNGNALIEYFRAKKVNVSRVTLVKGWITPTKTRFLAGWAHTVGQQVLRVDREPQHPLPHDAHKKLRRDLLAALKNADALAISDYGFGIATPALALEACSKRKTPFPILSMLVVNSTPTAARESPPPLPTKRNSKLSITLRLARISPNSLALVTPRSQP